jgi:hypothetical protein
MEVTTIGIDLAKNVFACALRIAVGEWRCAGNRRAQVLSFMRGLPRCVVGILSGRPNLPAFSALDFAACPWQACKSGVSLRYARMLWIVEPVTPAAYLRF